MITTVFLLLCGFQKREKRALANWKLLTKGLLIREKLKSRFDLNVSLLDMLFSMLQFGCTEVTKTVVAVS